MAAKLKEKRTRITTVRGQYLSFAIFPTHLISHWSLPFMATYRINFLSARFISPDSTFKEYRTVYDMCNQPEYCCSSGGISARGPLSAGLLTQTRDRSSTNIKNRLKNIFPLVQSVSKKVKFPHVSKYMRQFWRRVCKCMQV